MERGEEGLGQGQGVRAERIAGPEQPGDAGVVFQHYPQPLGQLGDLLGPGKGGIGPAVHLGQHPVEDAHAERLDAALADDFEGLGDDAFPGPM